MREYYHGIGLTEHGSGNGYLQEYDQFWNKVFIHKFCLASVKYLQHLGKKSAESNRMLKIGSATSLRFKVGYKVVIVLVGFER